MRAEGETKGVIKTGEVVTEMCTQGFSFFLFFLLTFVRTSVRTCSRACVQFPCEQVGLPLWRHTQAQTPPPPHTHTLCQSQDYFQPINPIQQTLKII